MIIFLIEIFLKVISLGIIPFFKDSWNTFDSIIVFSSLIPMIVSKSDEETTGISVFRSIRILRPLKTISSIKSLKILLSAFFAALPLLIDTFIILLFFFYIFAIIGLNIFSGVLKKRCFHTKTGVFYIIEENLKRNEGYSFCGNIQCRDNFTCGKLFDNPNFGVSNFDDIFSAFFQVFQCITLEGWSDIMEFFFLGFSELSFFYFAFIIIFGGFFLVKIVLAVLKVKFTESNMNFVKKNNKMTSKFIKEKIHNKKKKKNKNLFFPQEENYQKIRLVPLSLFKKIIAISKLTDNNLYFEKKIFQVLYLKGLNIISKIFAKIKYFGFSIKLFIKKIVTNNKNCSNNKTKIKKYDKKNSNFSNTRKTSEKFAPFYLNSDGELDFEKEEILKKFPIKLIKIVIISREYFSSSNREILM